MTDDTDDPSNGWVVWLAIAVCVIALAMRYL